MSSIFHHLKPQTSLLREITKLGLKLFLSQTKQFEHHKLNSFSVQNTSEHQPPTSYNNNSIKGCTVFNIVRTHAESDTPYYLFCVQEARSLAATGVNNWWDGARIVVAD